MTLPGRVIEAPGFVLDSDGVQKPLKGFDCNQFVSVSVAGQFRQAGFRFAVRYVARRKMATFDISQSEAHGILSAGLGLMLVQHVDNPGWHPVGDLGTEYGANAAQFAADVGYHAGAMLWCDLEGVAARTPRGDRTDHRDVIAFCNNWHKEVGKLGFTPGLYVGFDPGLTASELYYKLRFEHYWSAYNLNAEQVPLVRGVQMKQAKEKSAFQIRYDPDLISPDALGGLPLMLVDAEWAA